MNKNDLASSVASAADIDSKQAKAAVDAVLSTIASEVAAGNEVSLSGFGKFSRSERAARQGKNPATGETIQIAASKAVKFTAAKALKDQVNS